MFGPSVAAGLLQTRDLAGYRNGPVFIRASRHVPPRAEAVPAAMQTLFELLERESEPAVLAVLGHWLFGYVHPYQDGNGRMARFLMNVMLAAGGHAWTVIRVEDRDEYLQALEQDTQFTHRFLQPMDGLLQRQNTAACIDACLAHPAWRLSLQTHKVLGIP